MSYAVDVDVLVIGGGPAGLYAAREARESGLATAIVDEYAALGGQYYRRPVLNFSGTRSTAERRGGRLSGALVAAGVKVFTDALVYDGEVQADGRIVAYVFRADGTYRIRASAVVLATGGYDRVVPFPGWTLPGVLTAGGLQTLTKVLHASPGRRALIAGSGPFLLPVTKTVLKAGGTVTSVLEATTPRRWLPRALPALVHVNRSAEAVRYQYTLKRHGVRIEFGHRLVEVRGDGRAEEAVIASVDHDWQPIVGTEAVVSVDVVCVGYGFQPATQLPRLLGCDEIYRPDAGGSCPQTDAAQMTSVAGVFIAGEVGGIGGAHLAMVTGRIAGRSAAAFAEERRTRRTIIDTALALRRRWIQHFAKTMNSIFDAPPSVYSAIPDDTVVCRCEDVLARDLRAATAVQADINFVKGVTRAGMGPCQGRTCSPSITGIAAGRGGQSNHVGTDRFTARVPIKPVPLSALVRRQDGGGTSAAVGATHTICRAAHDE